MAKYRNNGGPHMTLDGTTIGHGEVFEDPNPDLPELFLGKFERVLDAPEEPKPEDPKPEPEPTPEPEPEKPETDDGDGEPEPEAEEPEAKPDRVDVTGDFDIAGENDMRVEKDKRGWYILDEGDEGPINEKPLLKREVDDAIRKYLAE